LQRKTLAQQVLGKDSSVTRLKSLKRHQSRRLQILVTPEQRTGQRHKLQNNSKTLLKEKERERGKHHKGSGEPLPSGTEALISLFKSLL
jgi:hypothetical protein